MSISASDITKLREATGAGMMDCKNALEEANGDTTLAEEILRKKGIIKAEKRASKISAEGTVVVKNQDNFAVVVEINSETDFVAKNEDFKVLTEKLTATILTNKPASPEVALMEKMNDMEETVKEYLDIAMAKIGEKISLRRFKVMEKTGADTFGLYSHMGGKIGVLLVLENSSDEALARDICMHIAASNPKYLNREVVDTAELDKEREIYTAQLKQEGKPENIIENILKGKINKFYSENCLLEQAYIKDEDKTIIKLLTEAGENVKIREFVRFELGEGMEKKKQDFASEVAEQLG
jgi:elongation factor Ts